MKQLLSVFTIILIVMISSVKVFSQQWTSEQKEVWAGVEKYWDVSSKGDYNGFMSYFDESYMGWEYSSKVPQNKTNTGKWLDYSLKNYKTIVYTLSPLSIWVKGDFAFVHYYYSELDKNNESGKNENNSGNWTDILMKKDSKWILIGDHGGRTSKE